MLLAAMGTACGGGAGTSSTGSTAADPTAHRSASSTTTTATASGLPQPKVVDHGDDFVAIASSLVLFGRWMEWHNPDPALVARAYDVGSPAERVVSEYVT